MAYLGGADIAAMLADIAACGGGVRVTLGAVTVDGLQDQAGVEIFPGEMPPLNAGEVALHVQTGSLPGLTSGVSVTVDGVAWVVREALPYGDGAMSRVALRKP